MFGAEKRPWILSEQSEARGYVIGRKNSVIRPELIRKHKEKK